VVRPGEPIVAGGLIEAVGERRANQRALPTAAGWTSKAILRPGHEITLVNVAKGGVLIQTRTRVLPGKRVDVQLLGDRGRQAVAGKVVRCRLLGLSPLSYEAAIALEEELAVEGN
jgi:hypothetical protein